MALANQNRHIYGNTQFIGIPKTIDCDIPLTDTCIGFATAVQQNASLCDQLMMTAGTHHRWFVVQTMGRDSGFLALHSGVAACADAILIPEIKFDVDKLAAHINKVEKSGRDYGIVIVSEAIKLRGHSGAPAEMISRELVKRGINARAVIPGHIQRNGDTAAADRILAIGMADAALDAVDANETFSMVTYSGGEFTTVSLDEMVASGKVICDPNIPGAFVSNAYVDAHDPLLATAARIGIYTGELK
jgi:6-phosphofructokinase 1